MKFTVAGAKKVIKYSEKLGTVAEAHKFFYEEKTFNYKTDDLGSAEIHSASMCGIYEAYEEYREYNGYEW